MIVTSSAEMRVLGQKLAAWLLQQSSVNTVLLDGPLGAGKTELAKGIIEGLGIRELVTSPTFSIINQYSIKNIEVYHIDLYRVGEKDLLNLGIEDLLEQEDALVIVEWASLHPQLFDEHCAVEISLIDDEPLHRGINLSGTVDGTAQWLQ